MTTKDIAKAQIYFIGKGGEILIGETADPITLQFIAARCRLSMLDDKLREQFADEMDMTRL